MLGAVATIIVAIGGGLAVLAYRHPREYEAVHWIVLGFLALLLIAGLEWSYLSSQIQIAIMDAHLVHGDQLNQLTDVMATFHLPWWWIPALGVCAFYVQTLVLVKNIPEVGKRYQQSKTQKDENPPPN